MLEITLLKLLRSRERMERIGRYVPRDALDVKTQTILADMQAFLAESEVPEITIDPFYVWFCLRHPTITPEQRGLYKALLDRVLVDPVDAEQERGIMPRLLAAEYANKVAEALQKFQDGEEIDLGASLRTLGDAYENDLGKKSAVPWVEDDINDILQEDKDDAGLHWRLECLNTVMRPARPGDFILMAGRPDKGKTTFVASEISYMAAQMDDFYGVGHGRYVIWACNEGPGKRIVQRIYQSALNATMSELIQMSTAGTIKGKYAQAVGALDRIRVVNIHDFYNHEVEDIFKRCPPGLVILDMVDNIKFGGSALNGGQRTDQILEAQYQWARMMAVKHDTPVIATSQISADGDGLQYPTLPMLKDSKTGKQGAADAIITLGAVNDPAYANSRFIGLTKNKLRRQGAPSSPQCEVTFDGERARLVMPQEV